MMTRRYSTFAGRRSVVAGVVCLAVFALCGCSPSSRSAARQGPRYDKPQTAPEVGRDLPPTARTLYSMAQILTAQGKDAEGEFVLRRCVQEHPRFTPAYNGLAELQMRQGRIHEAVATLSAALKVSPHDPVLQNNLGMCLLLRKEYEGALRHFTDAAGTVPENEKYRANMAAALGLLGRQEESLALLQQVLPRDKAEHNAQVLRKAYDQAARPAASSPPA
jgi:Flp pilus assembly protein TadD